MPNKFQDTRLELIEKVVEHVCAKLSKEEAPLVRDFLRQYYLSVSPDELNNRSLLDLYGAVMSHWHFLYQRKNNEFKVRAYNPDLEQDGWQSNHTIIEIICDDMPFLVSSIRMAVNRLGYNVYLMIHMGGMRFVRSKDGKIQQVLPLDAPKEKKVASESPIYLEIDKHSDPKVLNRIVQEIQNTLNDVKSVVIDWDKMCTSVNQCIHDIDNIKIDVDQDELKETKAWLEWLANYHFTFLGCAEYKFDEKNDVMLYVENTATGLLRNSSKNLDKIDLKVIPDVVRGMYFNDKLFIVGKTDIESTVHRPTYADFFAVKKYDASGKLVGITRFVGLFTSEAYNSSLRHIPFMRRKVKNIRDLSGFPEHSHDSKALLNIIETLPRDDLFHSTEEDLYNLVIGILYLQERAKIRLFVLKDIHSRYFSCLIYVPKEMFDSNLRLRFQQVLLEAFGGHEVSFSTRFSESVLARIHFVIRVNPKQKIEYNIDKIEAKLILAARNWKDDLADAMLENFGEEHAFELCEKYGDAFPTSYQENFTARTAVVDIKHINILEQDSTKEIELSLYRPIEDSEDSFRFKLYRRDKPIPLSDIVPMLENMGLRIISERPYKVKRHGNGVVWINDYKMVHPKGEELKPNLVKDIFQDAFSAIWHQQTESDGFNRLVLAAELPWRDIALLRAYFKYIWQVGYVFSQSYIEEALYTNSDLTRMLVKLFYMKFLPDDKDSSEIQQKIVNQITEKLEHVKSLSEDRIIRTYIDLINATLRTNFFQVTKTGYPKCHIAFKFDSSKVPELPLPKPVFEIFVYSPVVEGIHLRGAKVARGGLRWSDRLEDFRTEVLGLMKAQQVKNSVIVPLGAKGGFVVKQDLTDLSRDEKHELGVECYKVFIRGLLDITDNRCDGKIIPPKHVKRYDEDDPYLVVAADKGTATFSDIANGISKEYDFWLKDAFASGGSQGYDHKKMGITARGAWESVKMHFAELGVDTQNQDFTVIGIGDMAGDVFGNGMLLSKHIKLVAAFNHMHIFIDPNPDTEQSFIERKRLFELSRSSWEDYNRELISKGGGVFWRSAKSIEITKEMADLFEIKKKRLVPNELIKHILKAKVDLFWSGGIGTFVKANNETHADAGDRINDSIRVNGCDLQCRVVGEGGNLGFTQLARVEYAKNGGVINTDAIDNSAGVNCSDAEVNIKILLNEAMTAGDLTEKQRNELLEQMQDDVAEIVLENNIRQNESITMACVNAASNIDMHNRLIHELEVKADLSREIEFLPDLEEIALRKGSEMGLLRPEIAVLMAYTKILLKQNILNSDATDEPYFEKHLARSFPSQVRKQFPELISKHRLRAEIIATQLSNLVVNEMGINFIQRLEEETGASSAMIVKSYMVAREVYDYVRIKCYIISISDMVPNHIQVQMLRELNRLIRRGTRWYLRNRRAGIDIKENIDLFKSKVEVVRSKLHSMVRGYFQKSIGEKIENYIKEGVPEDLAKEIAGMHAMFPAIDIVEASIIEKIDVYELAKAYYAVGARLELGWFREQIKAQKISNHWEALARAAFRDDVDRQQRNLAVAILKPANKIENIYEHVENWLGTNEVLLLRWEYFINELRSSPHNFTMFAVALRELLDLSQSLLHFRIK